MSRDTLCISNLPIQFSLSPSIVQQGGQISIANMKTQPEASPAYAATSSQSPFYEYLLGGAQFQTASNSVDWSLLTVMLMIQVISLVYCSCWHERTAARPARILIAG
jgi:hypothetical protein